MKSTNRILAFLFAFILIVSAVYGGFAFADSALNTVYLVQPKDVYYDGGSIYVVDIINDGADTVIHQIKSDLTSRVSYYIDGVTEKISVDGLSLYVMQKDKIQLYGIDATTGTLANGVLIPAVNVKDFIVVKNGTSTIVYYITDRYFYQYNISTKNLKRLYILTDIRSISYVNGKVAIIYGDTCMTYTDANGFDEDIITLSDGCEKAFSIGTYTYFYNGTTVYDQNANAVLNVENGIIETAVFGNYLYVLGNDKKILQYSHSDGVFTLVENFVIGDDKIDLLVPSDFTDFTYAYATGYPTNILYEASQSSNPASYKLLTDEDKFILLHYDGMEDSDYYYVFYKGAFGWLEKSAAEISVDKLHTYDTTYDFVGEAVATAYIYSLPFYDDNGTYAVENVPKGTIFTITDRYENLADSNAEWFYASYEIDGIVKSGFIRQSLVTNLSLAPETKITRYTVNTDLTNQLGLYEDIDLTEPVTDEAGNPVVLTSGKQVSVISMDETTAFVQVDVDGVKYFGYIDATKLIKDGLTNYIALGLVLGILVILGVVFFVIMAKRRKKHVVIQEEMDPFEAEKFDAHNK
ncbi:MAG: hypothetical protein PHI78_05015 [Clostridia bacterium]|nr:hypothetical protein [Clostridia bacterium]